MFLITPAEAARRGFATRAAIYREIKEGHIKVRQGDDDFLLEVGDLVRVFGDPLERGKSSLEGIPTNESARNRQLEEEKKQKEELTLWVRSGQSTQL